jgi:hypothetical protein
MANIFYGSTSLTNKFQAYNVDNFVTPPTIVPTGIQSGGVDINSSTPLFSPRDNKADNAATSTGAITTTSGGTDFSLLFNKTEATYNVIVGGFANYSNGSVITTGVTYSEQSPTSQSTGTPTFNVPPPTVDTVNTTCSAAGTYTFNNSFTSTPVSGGVMVLKVGNYLPGTISGPFSIVDITIDIAFLEASQYQCDTYLTPSVTIISRAWSRDAGTNCTFSSLTAAQTIATRNPAGTTGITTIKCSITYTIGGTQGTISKTKNLPWGV